eukprot:scaffold2229_cov262-Pinguiococcus_pyrenoidosus.AAC.11
MPLFFKGGCSNSMNRSASLLTTVAGDDAREWKFRHFVEAILEQSHLLSGSVDCYWKPDNLPKGSSAVQCQAEMHRRKSAKELY